MSMAGWAITLGVVGSLAELAGVVLAIREIRDRSRKLNEYRAALTRVTARARLSGHGSLSAAGVVGGSPATLEERVEAVENTLRGLDERLRHVKDEAIVEAERRARELTEDTADSLRQEIGKVATLLTGSLSGHRQAYASVGFLVGGLVLQSIGNVLGNL